MIQPDKLTFVPVWAYKEDSEIISKFEFSRSPSENFKIPT
jgi:hypothetical protein